MRTCVSWGLFTAWLTVTAVMLQHRTRPQARVCRSASAVNCSALFQGDRAAQALGLRTRPQTGLPGPAPAVNCSALFQGDRAAQALGLRTRPQTGLPGPAPAVNCSALFRGDRAAQALGLRTRPQTGLPGPAPEVNCSALFQGDRAAQARILGLQHTFPRPGIYDVPAYLQDRMDCASFKLQRGYVLHAVTEDEATFPLAYTILFHGHIEQLERLLRAVYRPQNVYCIHLDQKSPPRLHRALRRLVACFRNVHVASRSVWVRWGEVSLVLAHLVCMRDLWRRHKTWKYLLNLTGQEWPLKTNGQLVKILKLYKGGNDIDGTRFGRETDRLKWIWQAANRTTKPKTPFTKHNVTLTKGALHMTASRGFVDYVLHSPVAQEFLRWVADTGVPDETFFSSLNHSPQLGVPGAFTGPPETNGTQQYHLPGKPYLTRHTVWWYQGRRCYGYYSRGVCVFGVRDLPSLSHRPELFLNKLQLDWQPSALDCMEQLHLQRVGREMRGAVVQINESFYSAVPWAEHHI